MRKIHEAMLSSSRMTNSENFFVVFTWFYLLNMCICKNDRILCLNFFYSVKNTVHFDIGNMFVGQVFE